MRLDPILYIDGYKVGHKFQYHQDTSIVFSNLTPRSNKRAITLPEFNDDEILWVGISAEVQIMLEDFQSNFFNRNVEEVVAKYKRRMDQYLGPDSVDTQHIRDLHDLGYLPVMIAALPEGSLVPCRVPVMTICNTDERFYWIVNYLETYLSAVLWQMQTSATTAFQYRCLLEQYAEITGSPKEFALWQGHDFSFRGMAGVEAAARSGVGHLASFLGTDTLPAIDYIEEYFKDGREIFIGGSVPASEHSVASTNILFLEEKYKDSPNPKLEAEKEFFKRYITEIYPSGVASYVSDTYDFWGVLTEIAPALKQEILGRKPNGLGLAKVVFRPDSGDPVKILTGYTVIGNFHNEDEYYAAFDHNSCTNSLFDEYSVVIVGDKFHKATMHDMSRVALGHELTEAEVKGAVEVLWDEFGGDVTDKGYKLLNQQVGLIYGDSITLDRAKEILQRLEAKGFASGNVVFGIGSFTYQHNTRDTHGFAIKSTYTIIDDTEIKVYKDPKTDDGTKKSAKGMLRVIKDESGEFVLEDDLTYDEYKSFDTELDQLKPVLYNSQIKQESFQDIRIRVNEAVEKKVRKVLDVK